MRVRKLNEGAILPTRGTEHSAGLDLYVNTIQTVTIHPHETVLLNTDLAFEIPEGCFGAIFPRSGISTKRGIGLANSVAVIDSDFRGNVGLPLHNYSNLDQVIEPHERVAQMVIIPYVNENVEEVTALTETVRGNGGFGHTGNK